VLAAGPGHPVRPAFSGGDYYQAAAGPVEGLALARGIGQVSYRTRLELERRFGRDAQARRIH
jgi:homoserine O-acetyltransferase